jgi:hypothetical protein
MIYLLLSTNRSQQEPTGSLLLSRLASAERIIDHRNYLIVNILLQACLHEDHCQTSSSPATIISGVSTFEDREVDFTLPILIMSAAPPDGVLDAVRSLELTSVRS